MNFFNPDIPLISRKKSAFAIQNMPGLLRVHWQIRQFVILSTFYTRHDQACLLWGGVSSGIFITAQFLPVSWLVQAIIASTLTLLSVIGTVALTWNFTAVERLTWVLYSWISLMVLGALITDLSILLHWGTVLLHICSLWLGLSAVGYLITGWGMRSRTLLFIGLLHLFTISLLPYFMGWQPLITGIVISGSAFLIAELQWDSYGVCGYQTVNSQT